MALGWFNIKDYGAVGDASHDDTSAVNAAIAALNANGRGGLYLPASAGYRVTSSPTALSVPGMVIGDGGVGSQDAIAPSMLLVDSTTAVGLTLTKGGSGIGGLLVKNVAAGARTAGAGIRIAMTGDDANFGGKTRLEDVGVANFYDNFDIAADALYQVRGFSCLAPTRYGFRLRNTVNQDAGDGSISQGVITTYGGAYGVYYEGGGGLRFSDAKLNGDSSGYGFWMRPAGSTTILLISRCSIENVAGNAIDLSANGHTWKYVAISDVQIGLYGSAGNGINVNGLTHVAISGVVAKGSGAAVVNLVSCDRVSVAAVENDGFGAKVAQSGTTNLTNLT